MESSSFHALYVLSSVSILSFTSIFVPFNRTSLAIKLIYACISEERSLYAFALEEVSSSMIFADTFSFRSRNLLYTDFSVSFASSSAKCFKSKILFEKNAFNTSSKGITVTLSEPAVFSKFMTFRILETTIPASCSSSILYVAICKFLSMVRYRLLPAEGALVCSSSIIFPTLFTYNVSFPFFPLSTVSMDFSSPAFPTISVLEYFFPSSVYSSYSL